MRIALWIIIILAVVLFVVGSFVEAVRFLTWTAVSLVLLAAIAWVIRSIVGGKS